MKEKQSEPKTALQVVASHSLSELINWINSYNSTEGNTPILKEDIVQILKEEGSFFLIYYK